ncbi:MAG: hypothetical protein WA705_04775 [Candidatus Ozemobacteraceae bacterium]
MDNIIEFIVAAVFIVFSIYSEMTKKKGDTIGTDDSSSDSNGLAGIEDFFKKQSQAKEQEKQKEIAEEYSREHPSRESMMSTRQEPAYGDSTRHAVFPSSNPSVPPPPPMSPQQQKKRPKKAKVSRQQQDLLPGSNRPRQVPVHASSEGACLDEGPSLTGMIDYDKFPVGSLLQPSERSQAPEVTKLRPRFRFSRKDVLSAFMFSELMQRYDLNRIYSRIPERRQDT